MSPSHSPQFAGLWARAQGFVARTARPLEYARWGVLVGGTPDPVLDVLAEYQNPDGGFGHALEPDFWNPASTPIQTWVAVEVLREVGFPPAHPLVTRLLGWLEAQWEAVTGLPSVVPGNNDHPTPPGGPTTRPRPTPTTASGTPRRPWPGSPGATPRREVDSRPWPRAW